MTRRLSVVGLFPQGWGGAVVHEALLKHLPPLMPRGWEVCGSPFIPEGSRPSLAAKFAGDPRADLLITTSAPLPARLGAASLFPFVYDVRWAWTRGAGGRTYRWLDLQRTLRRSTQVFTISNATAAQLGYVSRGRIPIAVVPMGPGQFEGLPIEAPSNSKRVLLMGSAPHKRNEFAAQLLVEALRDRPDWTVVCVSVSSGTSECLRLGLSSHRLDFLARPSRDELRSVLQDASVLLHLGTSEGFGMPYVEASYFGCDVIAPAQPIVQEVLGNDANILSSATPSAHDLLRALDAWDHDRVGRLQKRSAERSWVETGRVVRSVIEESLS